MGARTVRKYSFYSQFRTVVKIKDSSWTRDKFEPSCSLLSPVVPNVPAKECRLPKTYREGNLQSLARIKESGKTYDVEWMVTHLCTEVTQKMTTPSTPNSPDGRRVVSLYEPGRVR